MKNLILATIACGILVGGNSPASAEPPRLLSFFKKDERVEADKSTQYRLAAENGPYLVFAHSFDGENALQQAEELVYELRSEFNLLAFIHAKRFDYSEKVRGHGFDEAGRQKTMSYLDAGSNSSYAVLVGDFPKNDCPEIEDALKKVKSIEPQCLTGESAVVQASHQSIINSFKQALSAKQSNKPDRGPMRTAMITRNPELPPEFFQATVDDFIVKLNEPVEHSLLKCPARFTVRIAEFRGESSIVNNRMKKADYDDASYKLVAAAAIANDLVNVLRAEGVPAYEYHMETSSIVTVGEFNSIGENDENGVFAFDPEIQKVMLTFGGSKSTKGSQYGIVPVAKTLLDVVNWTRIPELKRGTAKEKMAWTKRYSIPLEMVPTVMAVPKANRGTALYSGSILGNR
jgi:hypothetical protein